MTDEDIPVGEKTEEELAIEAQIAEEVERLQQEHARRVEQRQQLFAAMVSEDTNMFGFGGEWPEDDQGKQNAIGEAGDITTLFILSQIQKVVEKGGTPKAFEVRLQVVVAGDEPSDLIVPQQKLIVPGQ